MVVDAGLLRLDLFTEVGHHSAKFGDDGVGVSQLPAEVVAIVGSGMPDSTPPRVPGSADPERVAAGGYRRRQHAVHGETADPKADGPEREVAVLFEQGRAVLVIWP